MRARRAGRLPVAAMGVVLAGGLLGGCGGTADPTAAPAPASAGSPAVAATADGSGAAGPAVDARACAGVQGVVSHLAADTARWVPQRRPFDRTMAARIRQRAEELHAQAAAARTSAVQEAVHDTAGAFAALAEAMGSGQRAQVTRAITGTRDSYRTLKQVCSLD